VMHGLAKVKCKLKYVIFKINAGDSFNIHYNFKLMLLGICHACFQVFAVVWMKQLFF
jgi:hypothetical protein